MSKFNNNPLPDEVEETSKAGKPSTNPKISKKRQGKGSKKRNDDAFRARMNEQELTNFRNSIKAKYGLFDTDKDGKLAEVVNTIQVVPSKQAVPLTVTTRSVGVATAIIYDRTCTTWNVSAIWEVCSLHIVYRVHLWLVWYKLYLAQQEQSENSSYPGALMRISMSDDVRQILATVTQVPSVMSVILDSIGKISTSENVYHSGIIQMSEIDQLECGILVQTPIGMDTLVETLSSNIEEGRLNRVTFIANNPIPGANFQDSRLINAVDIWPPNAVGRLAEDVHMYKNWITRVQNRLPSHTFVNYQWSGRACMAGLMSCERQDLMINSVFKVDAKAQQSLKRSRTSAGDLIETTVPPVSYVHSTITGKRTRFWSREPVPHTESVIGIAASVGEVLKLTTRMEMNSLYAYSGDTVTTLYALADAPR